MDFNLKNKTVWVTGASQGMGFATARLLATEGANVVMCARNEAKLNQATEAIARETGAKPLAIAADIRDSKAMHDLVQTILEQKGRLDGLFINGGAPAMGTLSELSEKDWQDAFSMIVMGVVNTLTISLPKMQAGASVVINTSNFIRQPFAAYTLPSTLRLAVAGLIKTTANEWGKKGIRINGIAPGYTRTQVVLDWLQAEAQHLQKPLEVVEKNYSASIPLGRFANPDEIATAATFLLSPKSSFIHGSIITVDGGESRFPL